MKKLNLKSKLKSIFSGAMIVALLCVSVFSIIVIKSQKNNEKLYKKAVAVADDSLLADLVELDVSLDSKFSLKDKFFLEAENQTTSNLCWAYASLKALETSFMVQEGEYHNFSEVGTAYLGVKSGEIASVSENGFFEDFSNIMHTSGLIYESDFGNEKYFDMAGGNIDNYSYVEDFATKGIVEAVQNVDFQNSSTFSKLNIDQKKELVKKYIQNYGGLFVGLEAGELYLAGSWIYSDEIKDGRQSESLSDHAVCLIGWDDTYGFLALNSWGNKISEFYIPYNYTEMYATLYGFFVDSENRKTEIIETTAEDFATNIIENDNGLENVFCFGEEISLTTQIDENIAFETISVKVFKGSEEVTSKFEIAYDDSARTIKFDLKDSSSVNVGGYYLIKFIANDEIFVDAQSLLVFTGTEVQYFSMEKNDLNFTDSVLMMNSYLTSDFSETFYINPNQEYKLVFNMIEMNKRLNAGNDILFSVVDAKVLSMSSGNVIETDYELSLLWQSNQIGNLYTIKIPSLGVYKGKVLNFKVRVNSPHTTLSAYKQDFNVNIVVSGNESTITSMANAVEYVLDGGKNSELNVQRYPDFSSESSMTSFKLYEPTKDSGSFIGWFTDKEFTHEITQIDSSCSGDLVLYAHWEKENVQYFTSNLELSSIQDNGGAFKDLSDGAVYGDSVVVKFSYTTLPELTKYNFTSTYYYYLNEKLVKSDEIQKVANKNNYTLNFEHKYPNMDAGNYEMTIVLVVVISHNKTVSETKKVQVEFAKREAKFTYEDQDIVYDGESHEPLIALKEDSVFAKDRRTFKYNLSNNAKTDCGTYEYKVSSINNINYYYDNTQKAITKINQKQLSIVWKNKELTYNGKVQAPQYSFEGLCGNDTAEVLVVADEIKNVGKYNVSVNHLSLNNPNYKLGEISPEQFEVKPATVQVAFGTYEEKVTKDPAYRQKITYVVTGNLFDSKESLNIQVQCEGLNATESGTYEITGTHNNSNYVVNFVKGTYVLLGNYVVKYTLPNGEIYTEYVEAGEDPKGIPEDVYKVKFLEKLVYSAELKNQNKDLYIVVSVKSYAWILWAGLAVVAFVSIYLIATRKQRRNKVS